MNSRLLLPMVLLLGCSSGGAQIDSPDEDDSDDSGGSAGSGGGLDQDSVPLLVVDTLGTDPDEEDLWEREDRPWLDARTSLYEDWGGDLELSSQTPTSTGYAAIHVRGNSSAGYDKKSYALETRDADKADLDVELLGLPAEEDWVLQGPYSDKSLLRNHLVYTWSRAIGRYAPRTRLIELAVDVDGDGVEGEDYRGVYVLMEKIKRDENRVGLAGLSPEDEAEPEITGGYLLRKDWVEGEDEDFVETEHFEDVIELRDPDGSEISSAQRDWLSDHLDAFEQALVAEDFDDPSAGWRSYADADSFADHLLLEELTRDVDAYVLSTYLHKDREGPLTMGPVWDFNGALGNADYFEAWEIEGWHFDNRDFPEDNPTAFCWYERMLDDAGFRELIASRWAEHRAGPLSDEALQADIAAGSELLQDSGAADRNFERWDVLGEYVWPNDDGHEDRETYVAEVAYLRDWVTARAAWMDEAVGELEPRTTVCR